MKVLPKKIDELINLATMEKQVLFDKVLVVALQFPNGFVLVGVGACVDPKEFDEKIGLTVALEDIANQLWKLEGYLLQEILYRGQDNELSRI